MQIMILDGSIKNDKAMSSVRQIIEEFFKRADHKVSVYTLRDLYIAPCCGFFCCWLKTPGICITDDIACEITKYAALTDCWVFLTPITFGGYSSELKKAIDRMTPLMLPYFTKLKGEVHHILRYAKHSHLIVFGSAEKHDAEAENIFDTLVQRNGINFYNKSADSKIILQTDSLNVIKEKVDEAFNKIII